MYNLILDRNRLSHYEEFVIVYVVVLFILMDINKGAL